MVSVDKSEVLFNAIEHIDVTSFDARPIVDAMARMSFTARQVGAARCMLNSMLRDKDCSIILTIAGSTSAAGCMKLYADMVRYNMVDAIVATGATVMDMDLFEALGFSHYAPSSKGAEVKDRQLMSMGIDRIYDTYIDEQHLRACDNAIRDFADELPAGVYSSREFLSRMGMWLEGGKAIKQGGLIQEAARMGVPIFVPAFSDCSAGFGLVMHQQARGKGECVSIDAVADFRELTQVKIAAPQTGLFMVGGGAPKNFAQDAVVCADMLGHKVGMHKYAVQITVADQRDGACSSSTLQEACSWGKVDDMHEQMVYAEATSVLPLIISAVYHDGYWRGRQPRRCAGQFEKK